MKTTLVNPTGAQLAPLRPKDEFEVRGAVRAIDHITVRVMPRPGSYSAPRDETYSVLTVDDGLRAMTVACSDERPSYYDGVLENIYRKSVEIGDVISIAATKWDYTAQAMVCAKYFRPTLIEPSAMRRKAYNRSRRRAARRTKAFAAAVTQELWQPARDLFGRLIMSELTKAEREGIEQIADAMPIHEQPTYRRTNSGGGKSFVKAFGVRVETLNRESFMTFARQALTGELANADKADLSELFRYMDGAPFELGDEYSLIAEALPVRIARLEALERSSEDSWDEYFLTEQLINHLIYCNDPRAVNLLAWFTTFCCDNGYFDTRMFMNAPGGSSGMGLNTLQHTALSALKSYLQNGGLVPADFDATQVTGWYRFLAAFPFTSRDTEIIRSLNHLLKTSR